MTAKSPCLTSKRRVLSAEEVVAVSRELGRRVYGPLRRRRRQDAVHLQPAGGGFLLLAHGHRDYRLAGLGYEVLQVADQRAVRPLPGLGRVDTGGALRLRLTPVRDRPGEALP